MGGDDVRASFQMAFSGLVRAGNVGVFFYMKAMRWPVKRLSLAIATSSLMLITTYALGVHLFGKCHAPGSLLRFAARKTVWTAAEKALLRLSLYVAIAMGVPTGDMWALLCISATTSGLSGCRVSGERPRAAAALAWACTAAGTTLMVMRGVRTDTGGLHKTLGYLLVVTTACLFGLFHPVNGPSVSVSEVEACLRDFFFSIGLLVLMAVGMQDGELDKVEELPWHTLVIMLAWWLMGHVADWTARAGHQHVHGAAGFGCFIGAGIPISYAFQRLLCGVGLCSLSLLGALLLFVGALALR